MSFAVHAASIHVKPARALVDDIIDIIVKDVPSSHDVTVSAILVEKEKVFISYGHYVSDCHGQIDLSTSPSLAGTYMGLDRMGLLWSMKSADGQKGVRLVKHDVSTPFIINLFALDGHVIITDQCHITNHPVYATCQIERYYKGDGVRAIPVREGTTRGCLFVPPGRGPFPGVIDMFGGAGGLMMFRSALLASRGFAVLSLPYFDYEDLPKVPDLKLEYFEEAIDWLYNHPSVLKTSGGVGVVGVSMGASLALDMATLFTKVKAVVSINGSHIRHSCPRSYRGVDLPMYDPLISELPEERCRLTAEGLEFGLLWKVSDISKYAAIPVEKATQAEFLFVIGEDDPSSDPSQIASIVSRFKGLNQSNYRVVSYPGAGHLIEPPYTPHCRVAFNKLAGEMMVWGGETRAHAIAQEKSWSEILSFLRKQLTQQPSANDGLQSTTNYSDNSKNNSKL